MTRTRRSRDVEPRIHKITLNISYMYSCYTVKPAASRQDLSMQLPTLLVNEHPKMPPQLLPRSLAKTDHKIRHDDQIKTIEPPRQKYNYVHLSSKLSQAILLHNYSKETLRTRCLVLSRVLMAQPPKYTS